MHLKNELVRYYHWLRQYGYNDSHSGNASVLEGDAFWITPTGACADILQADHLVACQVDGAIANGASLDAPLHQAVYQQNTKARAVFHSHGPYSVAITMNGEDFMPLDFEGQLYFSRVPVISIPYPDYVAKSPTQVATVLSKHPIVVVRGHGVYTWAENLNLAYKWTCSLEQSAKTAHLAKQVGAAGAFEN